MDKLLIVGLGLIGGSYAKRLNKYYQIYAIDTNIDAINYAKKNNIIKDGTDRVEKEFISKFDKIIFALYPSLFLKWIDEYGTYIKKNSIILDVSGVKEKIVNHIQEKLIDVEFIPTHPMAGKELSGVENADENLFINANYIITPTNRNSEKAILFAKDIGDKLGFRKQSILTLKQHDEMIGFLSQLTHCIAIALMTCKDSKNLVDYTGDSFKDLTRIANINENMWAELFLMNKVCLIEQMNLFEEKFNELKKYIENEDEKNIKEMMKLSTLRRSYFNK